MLPATTGEMLSPHAPSSAWSGEEIFSFATGVNLAALGVHLDARAAQGKKPHQGLFSKTHALGGGEIWSKWPGTHQDSETWSRKTTSGSALDANGNILSDAQGRSFTWDFENRLTQAVVPGTNGGTTTFKYDPFGRRIQKSGPLGTTNYLYDSDHGIEEIDQSGQLLARYSQGRSVDEPLAETRSGTTDYFQADGLGSITSLTSPPATIVATYNYDSFGNLSSFSGSQTSPLRYTAREFDEEASLYYYRARYLDQTTGRFLSEDSLRYAEGVNFYSYVRNNPTILTDPMGHEILCPKYLPWCPGHSSALGPPSAADMAALESLLGVQAINNQMGVNMPCDEVERILEQQGYATANNTPTPWYDPWLFNSPEHSGIEIRNKDGLHFTLHDGESYCPAKTCILNGFHTDPHNPLNTPIQHFFFDYIPWKLGG